MHQRTTTHDKLQAAVNLAGLELSASELHGMACGEVCRRLRAPDDGGLTRLAGLAEPSNGAEQALLEQLEALTAEAAGTLNAGMQFWLLMPGDQAPIETRTASLAGWARGFALALLRGEEIRLEDLEGDAAEFLRDLLKISEAESGEGAEEDERALVELEEYMRVGVQLVFESLAPDEPSPGGGVEVH